MRNKLTKYYTDDNGCFVDCVIVDIGTVGMADGPVDDGDTCWLVVAEEVGISATPVTPPRVVDVAFTAEVETLDVLGRGEVNADIIFDIDNGGIDVVCCRVVVCCGVGFTVC